MCTFDIRRSTEFSITDSHRTYSLKFKSYILKEIFLFESKND